MNFGYSILYPIILWLLHGCHSTLLYYSSCMYVYMYVVRMCNCVHQYIIKIDKTGYDHVHSFLLLAKMYYRSYNTINFTLVCVHVCHYLIKYYSLVMYIATNSYITYFLSIFILLYRYRFTHVSCFHVWPHIRSK